ncbi:hypothetical protein G647_03550 [Cladophialophora carrionii CBS 160.54]|uniref:Myb-like domain-containing protein n=1 Tax=Cladophialophora carrionii CBS 160.54 TaxID=1279043 RepID=V9DBV0_9EURO|nr:uncharacterized protein G647_03550 [Cladophialophora carrionii CBS 160.54]ETI24181.1 hypothetical protein G647_03550 [Cladophialophora carrionii CBS 160.54]
MADKRPTVASPDELFSDDQSRALSTMDYPSDSGSDVIEESAEQLFTRLIDEHESDFKQKLRALTSFAKILADDHAKSIKQLRRACKDYIATGTRHAQPTQSPKFQQHAAAHDEEAARRSKLPSSATPSTAAPAGQARTTRGSEEVARPFHGRPEPGETGQNLPEHLFQDYHLRKGDQPRQTSRHLSQAPDHETPNHESSLGHMEYHDDNADDDEAETMADINHEEGLLPDNDDATTADIPHQMHPAASQTPGSTPKPNIGGPDVGQTPKSGRWMTPKVKWAAEEEQRMIDIIHELSQATEQEGKKGDMWRRAEAMHRAYGYTRTWEQMAAKWSMQTRHKCKLLGYTWAENVMKRVPHMSRKRRALSPDDQQSAQNDSPLSPKDRRARKKSKKRLDAEATGSKGNSTPKQPLGHHSDLKLRYTFEGASSDIVQVDWSPDGQYFAAATNSVVDETSNFSHNRPRNLLYGSLPTKTIRELPEHRIERPKGQPHYVYTTVSAVKFGPTGHRMYTGGYDNKLRVWDVEDETQLGCKAELLYKNKRIEVMDVTGDQTTIVATGTHSGTRSVRVFIGDADLTADCKEIRPLREMGIDAFPYAPTCLKFGKGQSQNRLVAGFGQDSDTLDGTFGAGCMFVWEFAEAQSKAMSFDRGETFVSDCTWSPNGDFFVVGAVADPFNKQEPWEHSVVKLYSTTEQQTTMTFRCTARDINDVTYDFDLVTASCTDGSTYVWDRRNPRVPMHILRHGKPVGGYAQGLDRELNDVGVRYVEWTRNPGQLYTGGSDGFLKLWDTRRSQADVLLQDVVDIGNEILCGKFSPDHSSLVIGDEDGRLHLFGKSKAPLPQEDFKFMLAERWAGQPERDSLD